MSTISWFMMTQRSNGTENYASTCKRGRYAESRKNKVRNSLYRPFTKSNLFFDRVLNNCVYLLPSVFPLLETEEDNRVIFLTDKGSEKPFMVLMSDQLTDLHVVGPGL